MKKFICLLVLILLSSEMCFSAEWFEVFEKQYIHLSTIEPNFYTNTIQFWVKKLRKDPKELVPEINKPYWYTMSRWNLDCANKKERIDVIAVYDLQGKLMYSDEYTAGSTG